MTYTDAEFSDALGKLLTQLTERIGYTGSFVARLGNANAADATVRVKDRPGYVYIYREIENSNEVLIVRDGMGLYYSNAPAGIAVWVGYKPGSGRSIGGGELTVFDYDDATAPAFHLYGGVSPEQVETLYSRHVTPDRFYFLRIVPYIDLTVKLLGGTVRYGNTTVVIRTQVFGDLTDYVPITSGKAKYVMCCWNVVTQTPAVVDGTEFNDDNTVDPLDVIPTAIPSDCLRCSYVKLSYGLAVVSNDNIIHTPDIHYVPDASLAPAETTLVESSGNVLMDSSGNFLVIGT